MKAFACLRDEVDILGDGSLDLSDSVLEQMDIVIASVHSLFNQDGHDDGATAEGISNPNTSLLGIPRAAVAAPRCVPVRSGCGAEGSAKYRVAMELNSYPERLDLNDVNLRLAKQHGVKIVINTDSTTPRTWKSCITSHSGSARLARERRRSEHAASASFCPRHEARLVA